MITLNANVFLGTLTNLIAYAQYTDTLNRGGVNKLVDSCRNINVENGNGKVVRSSNILDVEDLDTDTSTLLSSKKPEVNEQYVRVSNYKRIQLTVNKYLMRGAWVDENGMAEFIGYLRSTMEETKIAHLYGELVSLHEQYTPTLPTQTVSVSLYDLSALTEPTQLLAGEQYNAKAMYKALLKTMLEMSAPTAKYNDLGYVENVDFSNLKLVVKGDDHVDMVTDALATLLNSKKITDEEHFGETVIIPSGQFTEAMGNRHALLMHKDKFQFGYFYNVATSFFDASTLNENSWLHFSYYLDSIRALSCVVFNFVYDKQLPTVA